MRLYSIILSICFVLASCSNKPGTNKLVTTEPGGDSKNQFPDDTYCAKVEYHNPNTGTNSSYTLTVEVISGKVTQINFPGGGQVDSDHFSGAALDNTGTASFKSDKAYEYQIKIIGNSSECFTKNVPKASQCAGITKKGARCKRMTDNPNHLCWQHQGQKQ